MSRVGFGVGWIWVGGGVGNGRPLQVRARSPEKVCPQMTQICADEPKPPAGDPILPPSCRRMPAPTTISVPHHRPRGSQFGSGRSWTVARRLAMRTGRHILPTNDGTMRCGNTDRIGTRGKHEQPRTKSCRFPPRSGGPEDGRVAIVGRAPARSLSGPRVRGGPRRGAVGGHVEVYAGVGLRLRPLWARASRFSCG